MTNLAKHPFTLKELNTTFNAVVGKSLGDVDINNVFYKTINKPKITGIAGDVVEQSILGYPADSDSSPDLLVDGIPTELKTTGIRVNIPKGKTKPLYKAKEPMSITAVSINNIVKEDEFSNSRFWHKLENLLLVYYNYDSPKPVLAAEYANFIIEGYQFFQFSKEDKMILENDWTIVRNFIRDLQDNYPDPKTEYSRLSSALRGQLMLIDTSPKYPNPPRFRLKQSTVTNIVEQHFGRKLEKLDTKYDSYSAIDKKLHDLTQKYKDLTVSQLIDQLEIKVSLNEKNDVSKNVAEQIIVKMFGGKSKKLSKIELFNKAGIIPKTIVTTSKDTRTEDMKLFPIDFEEWTSVNYSTEQVDIQPMIFEKSFLYNYFSENQFLCIIFREVDAENKLLDNEFIGFKRLTFTDSFINTVVKNLWNQVRHIVMNDLLVETTIYTKNGKIKRNKKTNTVQVSLNFPKSADSEVFLRGSGSDSTKKTYTLNGIKMYPQNVWIKGRTIVKMLNDIEYI